MLGSVANEVHKLFSGYMSSARKAGAWAYNKIGDAVEWAGEQSTEKDKWIPVNVPRIEGE